MDCIFIVAYEIRKRTICVVCDNAAFRDSHRRGEGAFEKPLHKQGGMNYKNETIHGGDSAGFSFIQNTPAG